MQTKHGVKREGRSDPSAQGVKRKEEGDRQGKAAENQHILLARCQAVDAQTVVEIFFEAAGLFPGAYVAEGPHLAAAHRAAEAGGVQILKRCARCDAQFAHPLGRVVDKATTAALEAVVGCVFLDRRFYLWRRLRHWPLRC